MGHAVHRATAQTLERYFPGRFTYNPTRGPDFFDKRTGVYVELTTPTQVGIHTLKPGYGSWVEYATYRLPQ